MSITLKQIDDKINTFSTNKVALQKLGHEIAMLIFRHAAPASLPECDGTADVTRALKLAKQMPKSWQPQLVEWFKLYSPVRIVVKNDKCGLDADYKALPKAEKPKAWKLDEANENPFYELEEPDAVGKTLSIDELIAMFTRIPKLIETKVKEGLVKTDDIPKAETLVTFARAIDFDKVKRITASVANDQPQAPATEQPAPNNSNEGSEQTAGEQPALSETLGVELKNVA